MELFDEDGYPTDEILKHIETYDILKLGYKPLFDLVKELWSYPEFIEEEEIKDILDRPRLKLTISTGGWSGNESVIHSLEKNWIAWTMTWYSSTRGGHYIFHIPLDTTEAV